MAKKVVVLNEATGTKFGFGERTAIVSETMEIADAEYIQTTYPGVYCQVIDEPDPTPTDTKAKAPKQA